MEGHCNASKEILSSMIQQIKVAGKNVQYKWKRFDFTNIIP